MSLLLPKVEAGGLFVFHHVLTPKKTKYANQGPYRQLFTVFACAFGQKPPKSMDEKQSAIPLAPFVLSLSKGECEEPRVPCKLFPPLSSQMNACIHHSAWNNPRLEQQKSTPRSPHSPFDRLRTNGAKRSAPYSISTRLATLLSIATCTLATAAPVIAQAQAAIPDHPAGRLFFTPEERDMFDRGVRVVGAATPASNTPRFDGMLGTRGRQPVLWVNGRMLTADDRMAGEFAVEGLVGQTLTLRDKKRSVQLKPGQRFDAKSGAVREIGQ